MYMRGIFGRSGIDECSMVSSCAATRLLH
ncbi:hypothetical protein BAE44_0020504 [Dichanthelium oligosanthes]|uniref:Uncharacterized protein n=1 Tax=Dichanthelium oligosanthes TaxID=888268 RepID=A0A1E5V058_9POAL|nr:hypothetical protein BAE44_0020504 [Dichanthelium oligosanthes]